MKTKLLLFIFTIILGHSYAQYCTAGPSSIFDSNVESVALAGATTSINFTGCPGVSGVQDVTTQVADLLTNNPYTANIQFGTCGGNYNGAGEAWIDFNGDDVFQASESIGTWSGTPPTTLSAFSFTVPAAATIGSTRMRVMQREGGTNPLNPCGTFTWGSVMDFGITIVAGAPITCPAPTNLNVTNLTDVSATLNWTTGGSSAWLIEYGPTGFTPGTGTITASNPYNISGLTGTTTYDWYVADLCAVGDTSFFIGPNTFTTTLSPIVCGTSQNFTHCYSNNDATTWHFTRAAGGTDPLAILFNSGGIESCCDDIRIYDGTSNTAPLLYSGNNGGDLSGLLILSTGADLFFEIDADFSVSCASGSGCCTSQWDFDVFCMSCPFPSSLSTTNITMNSATFNWTTGGSSNWIIEYGPAGFTPGSGTLTTSNPFNVTGLNASTTYDWYVSDYCGAGDTSISMGPISFGTICDTILAPYYQNFDVDLNDPHCWSSFGVENWLYQVSGGNGPDYGVAGSVDHTSGTGNFAWIDASGGLNANELVTPLIDYSSLTQGIVGFWVLSNNVTNAFLNLIHIEAFDGTSWVQLATYSGNNADWIRFYATIPNTIPTVTTFRIVQEEGSGTGNAYNNDILVDDFFVEEAPTCFNPTNLSDSIISPTSVELSWTTGGASNWIIEYGPTGFIPGTGAGTLVYTSTNPHILTVTSAQDYDWYVQDSCSATDISWHSYVNDFRMPGEVYCDSANNFTYCYSDNEVETYTYQSENSTSLLHIFFNSGTVGNNVNFTIYDGPDNTFPILYTTTGTTAMTGIDIVSSSSIIAFSYDVTSFLTTSCTDPLDFDINCCEHTTFTENIDICTGSSYTTADGTVVNSAGAYYSTIPNVKGCDSTITTIITVLEDTVDVMHVICSGSTYTLPDGTTTSVPGFYQQTIPNSLACDSTINLTLSMAFPTANSINASICTGDAYEMPDGSFISTAGNHSITLTNAAGCDSVYNVNLSLHPVTSSTQNVFICSGDLYTLPDGQVVSTGGTYTSIITNFNNCDSTITTNLVINSNGFSTDSIELCNNETYTLPNGVVVSEAGEYNISIASDQGCDSTITTYVSLCKTTGINGIDGNAILSIYPNPTNGIINIVFNNEIARKNVNVQLMNSLGQEIMQTVNADKNFLSLDVSNYAEGIYYIVVNDEFSTTIRKIIVSK